MICTILPFGPITEFDDDDDDDSNGMAYNITLLTFSCLKKMPPRSSPLMALVFLTILVKYIKAFNLSILLSLSEYLNEKVFASTINPFFSTVTVMITKKITILKGWPFLGLIKHSLFLVPVSLC